MARSPVVLALLSSLLTLAPRPLNSIQPTHIPHHEGSSGWKILLVGKEDGLLQLVNSQLYNLHCMNILWYYLKTYPYSIFIRFYLIMLGSLKVT
jgi:hypothetical protein